VIDRKYFDPFVYWRKIKNLAVKLLLETGISVKTVTRIDGYKITFVANSYLEYIFRAQKSFHREKVTMHWLRNVVQPEDVIYDIGANVGAYSLYAGYKVKDSGGRVYAFEPAFFNFFSLSRNIEANLLNEIVIPYPVALGRNTREAKFFLSDTTAGSALHGVGRAESEGKEFEAKFQQGVFVTTLDEFCNHSGVAFPNHIKIDVDGTESDIVSGMQKTMNDYKLKSVMIEIDRDVSHGDIEARLIDSGFQEVKAEKWVGKNTFNKLFVRL